jgi:hypothetical protein
MWGRWLGEGAASTRGDEGAQGWRVVVTAGVS